MNWCYLQKDHKRYSTLAWEKTSHVDEKNPYIFVKKLYDQEKNLSDRRSSYLALNIENIWLLK